MTAFPPAGVFPFAQVAALALLAGSAAGQSPLFATPHRGVPLRVFGSSALACGDLDGDGHPDVLVGNVHQAGFTIDDRLWRNDGTGSFVDATAGHLPGPTGWTRAIALGDLDGDGDRDAVLGHCANTTGVRPAQSALWINDGQAHFTDETTTRLPAIPSTTKCLALGDVDGDGDLDLLVGNEAYNMFGTMYGGQNRLLTNDGSGHFTEATAALPVDDTKTTVAIALGDVDADGDLDALVGHDDQCLLWLNDGAGHFTDATAARLPGTVDRPTSLALVDVDVDGDLDAVVANYGYLSGGTWNGGQSRLFANDGSGHFADATATALPQRRGRTMRVAAGDFDGDGDADLLFGGLDDNWLWRNDGAGHFAAAPTAPWRGSVSTALEVLDADGDGDRDVLTGADVRLFWNDGAGSFHDATDERPLPDDSLGQQGPVVFGDLDGDGDADALVAAATASSSGTLTLLLWRNDGLGGFADQTLACLPRIFGGVPALALGDVDGDGDLDVVVGHGGASAGRTLRLLRNDGGTSFPDVTRGRLPLVSGNISSIVGADFDGDGDRDLLVAAGSANRLLRNDGTGTFTDDTAASLPPQPLGSSLAGVADVDGDGDRDIVLVTQLGLWLNDGTGVFTDVSATHMPWLGLNNTSLALGDVDGDADVDLVVGTGVAGFPMQNQLLLNDGAGHFTNATAARFPAAAGHTLDVALADVDEDGDLDVLAAVAKETWISPPPQIVTTAERMWLWQNDGSGTFTDATAAMVPVLDYTQRLGIADVDGDGDLDVVLRNRLRDVVLTNLRRHVGWRSLPRIGKRLAIEVRGVPAEPFVLGASAAPAAVPWGALGTLRLDLAGMLLTHSGSCDASGVAVYGVMVPMDPALVGAVVYWQALGLWSLRLTGGEEVVVTAW